MSNQSELSELSDPNAPGQQTPTDAAHPPTTRDTPPQTPPEEGDATGGLIPYKNGPALAAYYVGLLGLVPLLGILPGAIALVLGIIGLKKRREQPAVRGAAHAWIGIIVGGGFALLWAGLVISGIVTSIASA